VSSEAGPRGSEASISRRSKKISRAFSPQNLIEYSGRSIIAVLGVTVGREHLGQDFWIVCVAIILVAWAALPVLTSTTQHDGKGGIEDE
jgi:type IV secretory pathway TrbD component